MKALIIIVALGSSIASADAIYIKGKPSSEITKLEAMRALITSDNKTVVYKCAPQEMSSKGTIKNK